MEKNQLYIPVNIKTRFEFFDGFGFPELGVTSIVALISGLIAFFVGDIYNGALFVLISASMVVTLTRKNQYNQSVMDMIKVFMRFHQKQQKYKYEYYNKYGSFRYRREVENK